MLTTTHSASHLAAITASGEEDHLIAVLNSEDATYKEKHDACRILGRIGSPKSIAVLADLLTDERLHHMARYGLEPNPAPAVDIALRHAAAKAEGRALAGLALSMGIRKDEDAVPVLKKLLSNEDDDVVECAARALGSIGTSEAAVVLIMASASVPDHLANPVCEGMLRCAEACTAHGDHATARKLYASVETLYGPPHQVNTAVKKGMQNL